MAAALAVSRLHARLDREGDATNVTTLRRHPECAGSLLEESSLLCVWRGTHPSRAVRADLVPA